MAEDGRLDTRTALKLGLSRRGGGGRAVDTVTPVRRNQDAAAESVNRTSCFCSSTSSGFRPSTKARRSRTFAPRSFPRRTRLAKTGVSFERHYVASVACVPSRTSLYTGHYPSLHGVANTDGAAKAANDPDMHWLLPGSVPTLGHYLRAGGYRTIWKGKWHAHEADLRCRARARS